MRPARTADTLQGGKDRRGCATALTPWAHRGMWERGEVFEVGWRLGDMGVGVEVGMRQAGEAGDGCFWAGGEPPA